MTYSLEQTETNKKALVALLNLPMPTKFVYFRCAITQRTYVTFSSIASAKNPIDD